MIQTTQIARVDGEYAKSQSTIHGLTLHIQASYWLPLSMMSKCVLKSNTTHRQRRLNNFPDHRRALGAKITDEDDITTTQQ